ncbi:MAG: DUF2956 domain-containing protein [Psychromonas sp.]
MTKNTNLIISPETQDEAMAIAKKTQKPGQTKEQTRLIALGIQKGIAEYKKMAKSKQRELNKANKKKKTPTTEAAQDEQQPELIKTQNNRLPWLLLALSWVAFVGYLIFIK